MKLPFEHQARTYQLVKHPSAIGAHKRGEVSAEALARACWYFRHRGQLNSLKTADNPEAIRRAKERLRAQVVEPDRFQKFMAQEKARAGISLGDLATEWQGLRCPKPNGMCRTEKQIGAITPFLNLALRFWGEKPAAAVRLPDLGKFAEWREAQSRKGFSGRRSTDLELNALSVICQWATATGHLERNPFADRPRFRDLGTVEHCHDFAPQSDEELHRLIGWFFASDDLRQVVAGGHLMFCALSGLRPGEPGALLRQANEYQPGHVSTQTLEGVTTTRMRLLRTKAGLNPGARIHPAMADFLDAWKSWLARRLPKAEHLFPDPHALDKQRPLVPVGQARTSRLRSDLDTAVLKLGLPPRHAHGFRAYYVRVRRSQGTDDSMIASEIGHSGGSNLVARTYGDPGDMLGSGKHDWLPEKGEAAWCLLRRQAGNVIALAALS